METSIFFARLLGPYCIVVAIGILFNLKNYQKVMEDYFKNTALILLGGVIAFLFGLIVVLFHNLWAVNWTVIITIFGWLGIIKGAWLIILPDTTAKITEPYRRKAFLLMSHAIILFFLGVVLTVKGYFLDRGFFYGL